MSKPGEIVKACQYFDIIAEQFKPGRKTQDFVIVNRNAKIVIGTIKWYGPWRQYCFYPVSDTVWSAGCLEGVFEFLNEVKQTRRNAQ